MQRALHHSMLHTLLLKGELPTLKAQESSNGHIGARRRHRYSDRSIKERGIADSS